MEKDSEASACVQEAKLIFPLSPDVLYQVQSRQSRPCQHCVLFHANVAEPSRRTGSLTLSLPRVINFKFPCSLPRNITSYSMKNCLLRLGLILTTSLIHFLFKRLGECTFLELGSEWVKKLRESRVAPILVVPMVIVLVC